MGITNEQVLEFARETNTFPCVIFIVKETEKAYLIDVGFEFWCPKSILRIIDDVGFFPRWFAKKNGLYQKPHSCLVG